MNQLSNYPPGFDASPRQVEIPHECSECGHKWDAMMTDELGGLFYQTDAQGEDLGASCPLCGSEGYIHG